MATAVPSSLKNADITRFAVRGAQLENVMPVISYYCYYWVVNQILEKGIQNVDQEALAYTTRMMDKLEQAWLHGYYTRESTKLTVQLQFKADNEENDAITDSLVGKAYVEEFGLETFQRADNTVRANKCSRQTADTFQAAATFLELLHIWAQVEPEIISKVKYAKFHALRIAKALKAGDDPNLSNPQPEDATALPQPHDAKVHPLNGGYHVARKPSVVEVPDEADRAQKILAQESVLDESLHPSRSSSHPRQSVRPRQPPIVDVPDEAHVQQSLLAEQSSLDQSLHPSRAPSAPPSQDVSVFSLGGRDQLSHITNEDNNLEVSPIAFDARKSSVGGNYFPRAPHPAAADLPTSISPSYPAQAFDFPTAPSEPTRTYSPAPTHQFTQPNNIKEPRLPPSQAAQHPYQPPVSHTNPALVESAEVSQPAPAVVTEDAMHEAQKHARWAISALNFEDVPTAIQELRSALEALGTRLM